MTSQIDFSDLYVEVIDDCGMSVEIDFSGLYVDLVEDSGVIAGPRGEKGEPGDPGPQGEAGPPGTSVAFQAFEFDPLGSTTPTVLTADQASTVLTDTTIGSTNNSTSPTLFVGFDANIESMSAANVSSGSLTLGILLNQSFQIAIFHDGLENPRDLLTAAFSGGLLYPHAGAMVAITGGGSSTPIFLLRGASSGNTSQNVASSGSTATMTLSGGAISIGGASCPLDTAVFSHVTVFVTQNLSAGIAAPVDTFNYTNSLESSAPAAIPDSSHDGDMLKIVAHDGVVLGSSVKIGDVAVLCSGKTQVLVFPDIVAAAAATQAAAQTYANTQDASTLLAAENYSDLNSARILQAAQDHTAIVVGETSILDRQYTRDQITTAQRDGSTFVANVVAGMDIGAGMPVYVSRATNKLMQGDSSTFLSALIIGYTVGAVGNGFATDVRSGMLTLSDWTAVAGSVSLELGTLYFLSSDGGLTLTPPSSPTDAVSAVMGKAVSATTFDFNPGLPIQL